MTAWDEYLNWDITGDRRIIRAIAWPKDTSLVVLDELHKAPKWKNLLKGVVDEFGNKPPLLVTGSAIRSISPNPNDSFLNSIWTNASAGCCAPAASRSQS